MSSLPPQPTVWFSSSLAAIPFCPGMSVYKKGEGNPDRRRRDESSSEAARSASPREEADLLAPKARRLRFAPKEEEEDEIIKSPSPPTFVWFSSGPATPFFPGISVYKGGGEGEGEGNPDRRLKCQKQGGGLREEAPPAPRRRSQSLETMLLVRQKRLDRRNQLRQNCLSFKPPPSQGGGGGGGGEDDDGIIRDLGSLDLSSDSSKFRFIWAAAPDTGSAIKILSINEMASKLGTKEEIRGEVVCSKCHKTHIIGFNLKTNSSEIAMYISFHKGRLGGGDGIQPGDGILRPNLPPCLNCCNLTLEPVIPTANNNRINWLFLFLGRMLGYCTVEQLDFFCKHSSSSSSMSDYYRTGGAKARLLYLTCITVCKQLYPTGPFDP